MANCNKRKNKTTKEILHNRGGSGSVAVGTMATVWDGEIAGIRLALESVAISPVLVLSDSLAVIASIWNAAACGLA